MRLRLFVAFALFLLPPIPFSSAEACSCDADYSGPLVRPRQPLSADMPANLLLFDGGWNTPTVADETLSAAADTTVARPTELAEGDLLGRSCSGGRCEFETIVSAPDLVAPSVSRLSNVRVELPAAPVGQAGCEFDSLHFRVEAEDARTAPQQLQYAVYFAETVELLAEVESPEVLLASRDAFGGEVVIVLGMSGERRRDGEGFRREGTFCFAVSAMDLAGNLGERSIPVCLDSTDTGDPLAVPTEYDPACSGLFCQLTPGGGSAPALAWAIPALLFARRRRRSARPVSTFENEPQR